MPFKNIFFAIVLIKEFKATLDFTPEEAGWLNLREGDLITNVKPIEDGFYEGTLIGQVGIFDDNFVKISNASSELIKNEGGIISSTASTQTNFGK